MRNSVLAAGVLDAASALVDVLLAVAATAAVVVLVGLARRWSGAMPHQQDRRSSPDDETREPIPVPSWRPGSQPPSVALPAPPTDGTYGARRIGHRFPEDPGRLL